MFAKKNINESLFVVEMMVGDENNNTTNYCNVYCSK